MLTETQATILRFIERALAQHGHAPTLVEIGEAVGIRSKGTVHRHVRALIDGGYLQHHTRGWRGIALGKRASPAASLPLVGYIAAGRPIEAIAGEDTLNLTDFLLGPKRYALRVRGESMIDAGILDGDTVIVEQRDTADDGDIVVALIDNDQATLKRLHHRSDGAVALVAENARIPPMIYSANRITIQGVVVAQLRSYR